MAKNPKRRQQKLERRAAKRKEKKKVVVRQQSAGLAERLMAAQSGPILHCWLTDEIWSEGIGWALLSRSLPNGMVAVAVFLIDIYCLGVKNVIVDVVHRVTYD